MHCSNPASCPFWVDEAPTQVSIVYKESPCCCVCGPHVALISIVEILTGWKGWKDLLKFIEGSVRQSSIVQSCRLTNGWMKRKLKCSWFAVPSTGGNHNKRYLMKSDWPIDLRVMPHWAETYLCIGCFNPQCKDKLSISYARKDPMVSDKQGCRETSLVHIVCGAWILDGR